MTSLRGNEWSMRGLGRCGRAWAAALALVAAGCGGESAPVDPGTLESSLLSPDDYVRQQCQGAKTYAQCSNCVAIALNTLYASHSITLTQRKLLESSFRQFDCTAQCVKVTCTSLSANCGTPSDVCGGTLASCGMCGGGDACGAVVPNRCGCSDNVQGGAETDVDCGGGTCATCVLGRKCSVKGDCASGACTNGVCVQAAQRVFVSSQTYAGGSLGGLAGADATCQTLATNASLGGMWKAWLSDSHTSASARLTHGAGAYKLVDGTVVANSWAGLTSGTLAHAISLTESGGAAPVGNTQCGGGGFLTVWTGTAQNGTATFQTCGDWTNTGAAAVWGLASATDASWTSWCSGGSCAWLSPIYCIEQ